MERAATWTAPEPAVVNGMESPEEIAGRLPIDLAGDDSMPISHEAITNGLYKAEVIHRRGPWRGFEAVKYATLE